MLHALALGGAVMAPLRRQPVIHDEIPEEGNGGPAGKISGAKRMRAVQQGPACAPGFLYRHQCCRTDGHAHKLAVHGPVPHETAMPGRTDPHAQTGNPCVAQDVFGPARLQSRDAGIRQADFPCPAGHDGAPESSGARASTVSRTVASDKCAYFSVVAALSWPSSRPTVRIVSPPDSAMLAKE